MLSVATIQRIALGGIVGLAAVTAQAHEGHIEALEEIVVYGRAQEQLGIALSASEGVVGYDDILLAPLLRVGELVEAVPGMVATQHSGTGKANQYFLRGFNLDHGTDFSAFAEGVPLNMRTHGHGQGYLDLNFLIPELVATTTYRKGPYAADVGDFSSAGTVEFAFYDALEEAALTATVGADEYRRGLLTGSFGPDSGRFTAALDATRYAGPWALDEELRQDKAYLSHVAELAGARSKVTLQYYDASWNATDQIPARAVASGLVDSLGYLDPDLGGSARRIALTGLLDWESLRVGAYAVDSDFELYSNFTYFLSDEELGDEFEQTDFRRIFGAFIDGETRAMPGRRPLTVSWGADLRYDDIAEVALLPTTGRTRTGVTRDDAVRELSAGAWSEVAVAWSERLRSRAGLRVDYFDWSVDAYRPVNSGKGSDSIVSPKLSLAYRFAPSIEGYANWGRGFHSNDVRGITIRVDPASGEPAVPVDPLVRSSGGEIGLRFERGERLNATLTYFRLDLDSELVFVGDAGTTEVNDGSRRTGYEFTAFWQVTDWLAANLQYAKTDARFLVDSEAREVPGAIGETLSVGFNAAWQNGVSAGLRLRYLGDAPLVEDGSVRSEDSTLLNARLAYRLGRLELRLDGFNLLDSDAADIAYYYASRLPGEPAAGIEDVHFHPLEPRSVRMSLALLLN